MNFILQNILAALLPTAVDGIKQVIGRFSGEVKPVNVDEQIKLETSQVDKLKALALLDNPYGTPSQWVVDLRASFRYIAAGLVVLGGGAIAFLPSDVDTSVKIAALDFAGMAFSFIFGDRVRLSLNQKQG